MAKYPRLAQQAGEWFRPATRRADRAWHRALGLGLLLAVLFHVGLIFLFRTTRVLPPSPFGAAGPAMGDVRAAAGGGGGLTMVDVRPFEERPQEEQPEVEPVPVPVPVPEVVIEPEPVQPVRERATAGTPSAPGRTDRPGTGGEAGNAEGPGTATGDGRGGGGTGETGNTDLVPPSPRGMILPPPDRPASVRGREVTVWVFVNARGRVISDSTRLDPPTADRKYNQRLMRSAAEWVFDPARRAGQAVAAWYPFQIIL